MHKVSPSKVSRHMVLCSLFHAIQVYFWHQHVGTHMHVQSTEIYEKEIRMRT